MTMLLKPFLRWAGSKRQLVPKLAEYWTNVSRTYIEPFLGSGALYFYLGPSRSILGDINHELIETYSQIRDNLSQVLMHLRSFNSGPDEYYKVRSLNPNILLASQRAARFLYLNRYAFNGLYRTNKKGNFNVPYGGSKTGSFPTDQLFSIYASLLNTVELISADFEDVLAKAKSDDFVYMDPPYTVRARRVFNEYGSKTFQVADLERLRDGMDRLTKQNVEFLVSYADSKEGRMLAKGYDLRYVYVRRNVAGFSSNRRKARELLISNKHLILHPGEIPDEK